MNETRPRSYRCTRAEGFADPEIAYADAALAEVAERLVNLVEDLSETALHFLPEGSNLSIARLVLHMSWAEIGWIRRLTGGDPRPEIVERCREGNLEAFDTPHEARETAEE